MTSPKPTPAIPLSRTRRAGPLLFVSGQLPRTPQGGMITGDIGDQTRQALANLATILESEGLSLADVVKTTVWLTSAEHAPGMNAAYAQLFPQPYPTRSTVISGLVADADVEIEAIAYDPRGG